MASSIKIRRAARRDATALIDFNRAMALETERKLLTPRVIGAGVRGLLRRPDSGFYTVAELGGEVIAALMVTKEWSDWRNGDFGLAVAVRPALVPGIETDRRRTTIGALHFGLVVADQKRIVRRIGRRIFPDGFGGRVHVLELDPRIVRPALVAKRQDIRAIEQRLAIAIAQF